ncbi:MAG: TonB family protein [Sutterellaceae bacterium]|nr:TonB family protein [Burkholderiaceae bacterium]MDW8429862.1 TonB family protein [Sutterellaceae bacterium]
MDRAHRQRNPARHLAGIAGVLLLHVLLIWGLIHGLARNVVEEVATRPIEVRLIEEVAKKPAPPRKVAPPPPKRAAAPPFVPPSEVNVAPPPVPAPTITQVMQPEAPPQPQAPVMAPATPVMAPAAPETTPAPAPPPAIRSAQVVCPNYREVMSSIQYPREALLDGIEGEVLIEFTVAASGQIQDPIVKSSSHRVFNRISLAAINRLQCQAPGQDIRVQAPVRFKIR